MPRRVMAGMGPNCWARLVTMAAPVGVVNSKATSEAATGTPFRMAAVAGAGTGSRPWRQSTNPLPVGIGEATNRVIPR